MALINMTEMIVRPVLTEALEEADCCKCERCYLDMLAVALNQLKPHYVNSTEGQLISKASNLTLQNKIDTNIAVLKAINIVSRVPHHNRPDDGSIGIPVDTSGHN